MKLDLEMKNNHRIYFRLDDKNFRFCLRNFLFVFLLLVEFSFPDQLLLGLEIIATCICKYDTPLQALQLDSSYNNVCIAHFNDSFIIPCQDLPYESSQVKRNFMYPFQTKNQT